MAKVFVADTLHKSVDIALQLNGARGYSEDTVLEWIYRYARQARLVDGASEVHKGVLARFCNRSAGTSGAGTRRPLRRLASAGRAPHPAANPVRTAASSVAGNSASSQSRPARHADGQDACRQRSPRRARVGRAPLDDRLGEGKRRPAGGEPSQLHVARMRERRRVHRVVRPAGAHDDGHELRQVGARRVRLGTGQDVGPVEQPLPRRIVEAQHRRGQRAPDRVAQPGGCDRLEGEPARGATHVAECRMLGEHAHDLVRADGDHGRVEAALAVRAAIVT